MEHKNKDENGNSLTVADVICKWYWGAAVGAGVGYLCGHALVGLAIGAAVGLIFQMVFNPKKGKKGN